MTDQTQDKALTVAQQRRLRTLWERNQQAQAALNEFVAYLRDEHDAAEQDGWGLGLQAFSRQAQGE